jgi:RNA polymerase sigma-70 factor (ECF subfamily)
LVQEVFLYVWERWEANERREITKPYLFQAVRNAALSLLRREGVARRGEAETIALFSRPSETPESNLRDLELSRAIERAVMRLPERCRLVFTLSREQGLTYNQIAQLLEISPKTVETQMARAFRALREYLAPYWP